MMQQVVLWFLIAVIGLLATSVMLFGLVQFLKQFKEKNK
jgi:hypothetical protein